MKSLCNCGSYCEQFPNIWRYHPEGVGGAPTTCGRLANLQTASGPNQCTRERIHPSLIWFYMLIFTWGIRSLHLCMRVRPRRNFSLEYRYSLPHTLSWSPPKINSTTHVRIAALKALKMLEIAQMRRFMFYHSMAWSVTRPNNTLPRSHTGCETNPARSLKVDKPINNQLPFNSTPELSID